MLAIIPARAGSKGVPGKNVRKFNSKPLIQWTLDAARLADSITEIAVTTDDVLIYKNSKFNSSCDVMIKRPAEMSKDDSPASLYIRNTLELTNAPERHEYFCVLQPTSPLRIYQDIDQLYRITKGGRFNSGVTVVQVPHNFTPESLMENHGSHVKMCARSLKQNNLRQEKKSYFARNGAAVYICKVEHFLKCNSLFDKSMAYLEMPMLRSVDIDTEDEFRLAELIQKEYG